MAKMSFSAKNRTADLENFPKIRLENKETARVVVLHEPESAFVHNLRAPKLVGGVVQYKGEEMDFDFIGNPICLGNEDIVKERGLDTKNCPACAAVSDAPDMFQVPKRKYATHVYQYQTNGSAKAPVNGEGSVKVWAFADGKFNELIDIYEEAELEDPTQLDLVFGPCENVTFQKFAIKPGQKTAWMANESTRSRFNDTVEANKSKDLYRYIGRKMGKEFMADKVDDVRRKWAQAKGQEGESASDGLVVAERDLGSELQGILDETPEQPKASATTSARSEDNSAKSFDDIMASLDLED